MKKMVYIFMIVVIISNVIIAMDHDNMSIEQVHYILVNRELKNNFYPLSIVKNPDNCKLLLDKGADPNKLNRHGHTPLSHQVMTPADNSDVIELLLQHGAIPNIIVSGRALLSHAIDLNYKEKVEVLLRYGADVSSTIVKEIQPNVNPEILRLLMSTVINNKDNVRIIDLLLRHGVDPNMAVNGVPLLSIAIEQEDVSKVKALLRSGADVSYEVVTRLRPRVRLDILDLLQQYGSMMMCRSCRTSFFCMKEHNGGTFFCTPCISGNRVTNYSFS